MHRINGYGLYFLGTSLGALSARLEVSDATFQDLATQMSWSRAALGFFIGSSHKVLPLKSTQVAAHSLVNLLTMFTAPAFLQANGAEIISEKDRGTLTSLISNIGVIGASEMAEANTYFVAAKRGWDMSVMIDEAELTLSEKAKAILTDDELKDIREAGRCLAFEVPTAAAFHLYRALESVVLKYIPLFPGVTLKESDRNLGHYIGILKGNGVDSKITTMLGHIKDEYRNPAIHPGLFLDVDGAASQFALVQSAIHMMAADIGVRTSKA